MTRVGLPARPGPLLTIGPLLALAVVCWAVVVQQMGGEDGGPGADPGPLDLFTGMWTLMMAAMMLPSVWPTVLVYRGCRPRGANAGTTLCGWARTCSWSATWQRGPSLGSSARYPQGWTRP